MTTHVTEWLPHYVTVAVRLTADLKLGSVPHDTARQRMCDFLRYDVRLCRSHMLNA